MKHLTSIVIAGFIIQAIAFNTALPAQSVIAFSSASSSGWSRNDIFQNKVFIENKGQFDTRLPKSGEGMGKDNLPSAISYGIISSGQEIYFSSKGLTFRYDIREYSKELLAEIENEKQGGREEKPGEFERKLEETAKTTIYAVNMEWLNANPDVNVQAEDIVPEYYTYGDGKEFYKAAGYKKLIYRNLYPNIDVEYIFHDVSTPLNITSGIKYSLILHPGADPSKIQMKYSGADKIYKDADGNIHLVTALGDIIDHAPFTFYDLKGTSKSKRSVIPSAFSLDNNIVSFTLKTSASQQPITNNQLSAKASAQGEQSTIIIDPWTVGVTMPASNKALEVEKDAIGNVYISGGAGASGVLIVQKFSPTGVLQWTYTPIPNGCSRFDGYYGNDLKVDAQGNIYFDGGSSACAPTGNKTIIKLTPAGTVVWVGDIGEVEPYRLLIDCGVTTLYLTGSWAPRLHIISPVTGIQSNMMPLVYTANGTSSDDMRDVIRAPNGNYYGVSTAQPANNATVRVFNPTWTQLLNVPAGFNVTYWFASYTGHAAAGQPASLHLVAASRQFLFVTNGATLQKRNLTTGALITSVAIPGGTAVTSASGNSGIVTDTCGNVYVGTQNSVRKYDPNLVFISSAATTAAVYDLCLGINGEILASGNGFLASVNLSACTPAALNVTATATPTGNCNNGNIGTATATTTGGDPSYSYYWIPGGQTTPSVSGLGAGTYSVIVTDMNCNKDTAIVTVTSAGALVASVTKTNLQCNGAGNGSATVSASNGTVPYTYAWSTGSTAATVTGLSAITYSVTVTDANGCKSIMPVNISQPSPIPLGMTATATTCNNPNGTSTVSATGTSGPYTYSWSSGSSGTAANGLSAGIYTVTVRDAGGCSQTATATIAPSTSPADPSFTQSPGGTVCMGTAVNFTHTGSAGTYNWVISPISPTNVSGTTANFSYTFLSTGTYTVNHTVTNGGCTNSKASTVTVINCTAGPTVTATGSSVCPGTCAAVTSNGAGGSPPYTYSWSNSATTQNINPCPASTTTYTVTIRDAGGNTSTSSAVVTVNPAVTVTTSPTNITCNGSADGKVVANPGTGTSPYTYSWSAPGGQTTQTVSGLSAGNYTVTVTDAKGCTGTTVATISSPPAISGQFTKGTANCIGCGCKEWVMITGLGGTSPYSYSWSNSGGYNQRYLNQVCPGAYSISITDKNGCSVNINLTTP
ncbi:MAG: hypothetical protein HYU69_09605 [Bacteroidetes bacterium]|nr:hypothetical protein [Bacteroidota bacterium]